jgi:hypothetical protein
MFHTFFLFVNFFGFPSLIYRVDNNEAIDLDALFLEIAIRNSLLDQPQDDQKGSESELQNGNESHTEALESTSTANIVNPPDTPKNLLDFSARPISSDEDPQLDDNPVNELSSLSEVEKPLVDPYSSFANTVSPSRPIFRSDASMDSDEELARAIALSLIDSNGEEPSSSVSFAPTDSADQSTSHHRDVSGDCAFMSEPVLDECRLPPSTREPLDRAAQVCFICGCYFDSNAFMCPFLILLFCCHDYNHSMHVWASKTHSLRRTTPRAQQARRAQATPQYSILQIHLIVCPTTILMLRITLRYNRPTLRARLSM